MKKLVVVALAVVGMAGAAVACPGMHHEDAPAPKTAKADDAKKKAETPVAKKADDKKVEPAKADAKKADDKKPAQADKTATEKKPDKVSVR